MDYYSYDFVKNHLIRDQCQLFLLTRATLRATPLPLLGQVEVQHFRDQLVIEASVSEYRLSLLSVL